MANYEFWRDKKSGEVWAIRLDADRQVTGVCGVLFEHEIVTENLPDFHYSDDEEAGLDYWNQEEDRQSFDLYEP